MKYSVYDLRRLTSLLNYYIPRDGHLQMYRDFIESLPTVDNPEAFGQNSNAEMTSLMGVNRTVCETLMVIHGQSSTVSEETKEMNVFHMSSKILKKLPNEINYAIVASTIGTKRNPLDVVLLQEVFMITNVLFLHISDAQNAGS